MEVEYEWELGKAELGTGKGRANTGVVAVKDRMYPSVNRALKIVPTSC